MASVESVCEPDRLSRQLLDIKASDFIKGWVAVLFRTNIHISNTPEVSFSYNDFEIIAIIPV